MNPQYILSQINIYPFKSLQGISLLETEVQERGLKYDRRWMLVDNDNIFITQRNFPQMALIDIKMEKNKMVLTHRKKELEQLKISLYKLPTIKTKVKVWNDECESFMYENEINEWFTEAIDKKVKLVFMTDSTERKISNKYYKKNIKVSFADGYPFLIIGQSSLDLLNSKLQTPVTMNRFRPNLVFSGGIPHDEDQWVNFKVGSIKFHIVKPCSRCILTTVNPVTGIKGKEPLYTLSKYRMKGNKVLFGQNLIAENSGVIKIGDHLKSN